MSLPANAYLYEFLYRGQPVASLQPSAWHVILAVPATDAFGAATLALSPAMTPGQAADQGINLPDILASINANVMADLAVARAQIEVLTSELAKARATPASSDAPAA